MKHRRAYDQEYENEIKPHSDGEKHQVVFVVVDSLRFEIEESFSELEVVEEDSFSSFPNKANESEGKRNEGRPKEKCYIRIT